MDIGHDNSFDFSQNGRIQPASRNVSQEKLQISISDLSHNTKSISPSATNSVEIQIQVFTIQGFALMYSLSLGNKVSFTVNRTN